MPGFVMSAIQYALRLIVCLALCCAQIGAASPAFASTKSEPAVAAGVGKRLAIVIGNSSYKYVEALKNPKNDAQLISKALRRLNFDVVERQNLDFSSFVKLIEESSKKAANYDAVLFFYAGHGFQLSGRNFLVPVDARLKDRKGIEKETIALDDVVSKLDARNRQTLIFLDACRNNPIPSAANADGVQSGLAEMKAGSGTFVAFATQPGNVTNDGAGNNSPFSLALANNLADAGNSISDMMIKVRNEVEQTTLGRQTPWDQSSLRSQFYFNPHSEESEALTPEDLEMLNKLPPALRATFLKKFGLNQDIQSKSLTNDSTEVALASPQVPTLKIEPETETQPAQVPKTETPPAPSIASNPEPAPAPGRSEPVPETVRSEPAPVPPSAQSRAEPPVPPGEKPADPISQQQGGQVRAAVEDNGTKGAGVPAADVKPKDNQPMAVAPTPGEAERPASGPSLMVLAAPEDDRQGSDDHAEDSRQELAMVVPRDTDQAHARPDVVREQPKVIDPPPPAPLDAGVPAVSEPTANVSPNRPEITPAGEIQSIAPPSSSQSQDMQTNAGRDAQAPQTQAGQSDSSDTGAPPVQSPANDNVLILGAQAKADDSSGNTAAAAPSAMPSPPVEPAPVAPPDNTAKAEVAQQDSADSAAAPRASDPVAPASPGSGKEALVAEVPKPETGPSADPGSLGKPPAATQEQMEVASLQKPSDGVSPAQKPEDGQAAPIETPAALPQPGEEDRRELARKIQVELQRLGCYRNAADGDWGAKSARALLRFYAEREADPVALEPNETLLGIVSSIDRVVCKTTIVTKPAPPVKKRESVSKDSEGKKSGSVKTKTASPKAEVTKKKLSSSSLMGAFH